MFEIEKLPAYIREAAADKGIRAEDIYLTAYCDMDSDHIFCDTYLIATADIQIAVTKRPSCRAVLKGVGNVVNVTVNTEMRLAVGDSFGVSYSEPVTAFCTFYGKFQAKLRRRLW